MTETMLGTLAVGALGVCVIDSWLWMAGGRSGKWKRRYIGAFIQSLGLSIAALLAGTWHWVFLAIMGPEVGSRSLGYGGDTTPEKISRRTVFAAGSLFVGALLAWGTGFSGAAIIVLICQTLASACTIVLGVKNPVPAAVEEVFVCFSLKYFNYAYIFINYIGV